MFRFKECREKAGLTQKEAALSLKVSVQSISNWETGIRSPGLEQLVKIAELYSVTTDYLLGREPVKVTGHQATELPPVKPGMVRIAIAPGENLSEEEIGRRITQAVLSQVPDLVEKELKKRGL